MSDRKVFSQVTIDLMNKTDLPEILAIERESFASPWTAGMFSKELDSAHARCLCARINSEDESVVGGYIVFWLVAGEAHLHNLAVKKEYRRQGLAFVLMEAMKEIAVENKIVAQTLEVRESNTEAIKLYRKCGFVVKGIRPLYYTDTFEDALIMWADVKK
ncbi:MAG: ribosomal-protein-alanine N-acetyltransferase [Deltaproteobacteria bacterium HGW-Deltaproteobacteria-13]|jgi:ribosomal-protein-alanine N-acetyltransferase|nr:MAG: ribosomal-protein-alanine N-acetyltransferase [Deltaproteobacteria bacterium HGW-Deltaproteobacteria-13]